MGGTLPSHVPLECGGHELHLMAWYILCEGASMVLKMALPFKHSKTLHKTPKRLLHTKTKKKEAEARMIGHLKINGCSLQGKQWLPKQTSLKPCVVRGP